MHAYIYMCSIHAYAYLQVCLHNSHSLMHTNKYKRIYMQTDVLEGCLESVAIETNRRSNRNADKRAHGQKKRRQRE